MNIHGIQKLTLIDYPGKVACTLFAGGCNFRCPFCHNAGLVLNPDADEALDEKEILAFLKKRINLLDGVCITGGEPLLQKDVVRFAGEIKKLGYAVKIDTNGSFPDRLKELVESKNIDYVAMDIKNAPSKYALTVGIDDYFLSAVQESVEYLKSGVIDFEFRTTAVRQFHTPQDFIEIGKWIQSPHTKWYLQNFCDSGNIIAGGLSGFERFELENFLEIMKKYVPKSELREIR
ncbi:MAG TPA: anaerobic ribonucleoside-triphosphate reductase activating protein [Oscillospiraceae bacterium]|nr:anaerobic ribonucleoside-triphosphate reductase activating protein [Oscillospiraceae bacterium]HPF56860.1 anaerobic ribonucleoside-triphosphate reductase activating protein [Clostridiales bacterium]HPK36322.1 anaerobic ribonucleoside-triphosphate reductase activating protein [Oscillospiraceae bacterium]HPR76094.1 anaerobic ribonucleoside-triphosphate reductase activating protein [Oscillospiraceae bacterium]